MTTFFDYPPEDVRAELREITESVLASGKGILAADESVTTIGKRFADVGLKNTRENRRQYRQLLFSTDPKIADNISTVILTDETFSQETDDGMPLIELLKRRDMILGIKVDKGLVRLLASETEWTTQGLDNLAERCLQYRDGGCKVAKWRCAFKVSENTPTPEAVLENANQMGRFAAICQTARMVPLLEPDVSCEGDHILSRTQKVTETVLAAVFKALSDHHVFIEAIILKPNMVTAGQACKVKYTSDQVALATVQALRRTVPPAVPGIAFLSAGLSEEDASVHLNAINRVDLKTPWRLTFCFGRALQHSVLNAWAGDGQNHCIAQNELLKRALANCLAVQGRYEPGSVAAYVVRNNAQVANRK